MEAESGSYIYQMNCGGLIYIGSGSVDRLMNIMDCETRVDGLRMGTMVILGSSGWNMELDRNMLNV